MSTSIEPGDLLRERYRIREIIGHGGMGSIYLAEDQRLPGRLCAVKQVRNDPNLSDAHRAQTREQFYREASVLARLDHPNLPKVSDFFSESDNDYLVMDYVPGDDLKSRLDQARCKGSFLAQKEVLQWAAQISDALDYLHQQEPPVIHRDIKPSNLKLTPSGLVKLVDFGLVKQMVPDEMTITVIQGRGTALYTPLEQYGGDAGHTDPRSDIYAFGATLYHLLTGRSPAEAKNRFLQPSALTPPRAIVPSIDPHVEQAILWAMALHPNHRPQDIQTFQKALFGVTQIPSMARFNPAFERSPAFLESTGDKVLIGIASLLMILAITASLS